MLALKGFLLFLFVAATVSTTATASGGNASVRDGGVIFASGISAAYIITNIQKWKRERRPIKGAVISWTVAVFLLLGCLGTFIGIGKNENVGTTPASQANSTPSTPSPTKADHTRPVTPPQASGSEVICGTGKTCRVRDNGKGDNVFIFASEDALKEVKGSGSIEATRQEMAALVFAGQLYMVPNGTNVTVLDWSGWHGWHKVRIVSPGTHTGRVGYVLDQWTAFE